MSWIALAAMWASASGLLLRRTRLRGDEAFLAGGLAAVFEALAESTVLGWAGWLSPRPVLLLAAVTAGAQWFASALEDPVPRRRADAAVPWPWPLRLAAGFALAVALFRLALAAAIPPESWDGLGYHLPLAWRWVSQGNFDLAGWSGPQRYFPWNGELLPAWMALLDGRSLAAAKLAQVLALPLLGGAGAVLGRRLAGRAWSAPCAVALAALPIAILHAGIPYVDALHAAFWLSAAAFAAAWDRSGRRVHLLAAALAFGLALGTKSTLYFMAPLAVPVLAPLVEGAERRRRFLRALPWAAALAFAAGGACYLRNWIETGSPIFPYALKLAGVTIFPGPSRPGELLVAVERWFVPAASGWLTYPLRETMRGAVRYSSENGFGPLFAAGWFLLPWSAFLAWRRRDRALLAFLALVPGTALFFLTLHPTREPRYVIFLAGVPIVGLAAALKGLRGRARLAAVALWSLGVVWGTLGVLDYAARDSGLLYAWSELKAGRRPDPDAYYERQYESLGRGWAFLNARLKPGDVVALNYGELMMPWAGRPPRARVEIVGRRPSDLPGTLWAASDDDWLDLLDRIDARYVVVWTPAWYPDVGAVERATIAAHPERFSSLGDWRSPDFGRVSLFELAQ
jgi:hypothetical protein